LIKITDITSADMKNNEQYTQLQIFFPCCILESLDSVSKKWLLFQETEGRIYQGKLRFGLMLL